MDVFWDEIKKETVGIGPITQFDVSDYKVKIAAQVKGFDARERLDFKSAKRMELFTQYAAAAAKEAFEDAGIDMEKEDPYRAGVIVGSGVGSLKCVEDNYETILKKGPNRVHPLMVPLMISNMRREIFRSAWTSGKMHKCRDGMRLRFTLYRRCFSGNPVW